MLGGKKYRLIDIARQIDRDKSTIIRWEELELIPTARRDSRGWRFYSEKEVKHIVELVKKTSYFKHTVDDNGNTEYNSKPRSPKVVYIGVAAGVMVMLWQLFTLGLNHVSAVTNATTTMYSTITAGALDVLAASSSNSFTGVNVSFSSQTSTASDMGAVNVEDARGSGAGWTLNLSCNGWKAGTGNVSIPCDGNGTDGNQGKMCVIVASGAIESSAGQDTTNVTKGAIDCFSAGTSSIDIYTAATDYGKGNYWVTDFSLQQYIPSNPTSENITTTIVLTLT